MAGSPAGRRGDPFDDGRRLIFVGGAPRSGTTLVQNMLDSHDQIVGAPEFLHLPDIVGLRDRLVDSVERGFIDTFCTAEDVTARIRELIESFLAPFFERSEGQLLSAKTPTNVLVFTQLLDLFPAARFVFVVRDPRATVASLLAVGERARAAGEKPVSFAADAASAGRWVRRCIKAGLQAEDQAPERVHRVAYEKLVVDPVGEGKALCSFLGVEWQEQMARPGDRHHPGETAITDNSRSIWYDHETYNSNPHPNSLELWKKTLTVDQRLTIRREFRDGELLGRLGYELNDPLGTVGPLVLGHIRYFRRRMRERIRRQLAAGP